MAKSSRKEIVEALLTRHGKTYTAELGIPLGRGTPSPLFRWLCAATLFSARINAEAARSAAAALADAGWTTAEKMAASTWAERTRTLNRSGYARYDESTSRMLGDTVTKLQADYGGDLRKLREAARRKPADERKLLQEFKGIGEVGVDIFMREVQAIWDENFPFADKKSLNAAARLGLGRDVAALARLVDRQDFPRLVAALVRTDLAGDYRAVSATAAARS